MPKLNIFVLLFFLFCSNTSNSIELIKIPKLNLLMTTPIESKIHEHIKESKRLKRIVGKKFYQAKQGENL